MCEDTCSSLTAFHIEVLSCKDDIFTKLLEVLKKEYTYRYVFITSCGTEFILYVEVKTGVCTIVL